MTCWLLSLCNIPKFVELSELYCAHSCFLTLVRWRRLKLLDCHTVIMSTFLYKGQIAIDGVVTDTATPSMYSSLIKDAIRCFLCTPRTLRERVTACCYRTFMDTQVITRISRSLESEVRIWVLKEPSSFFSTAAMPVIKLGISAFCHFYPRAT